MLIVHHLENSRSQRVIWLLEELDMPYKIIRYERDKKTSLAPQALKDVHPLGKAPMVQDGDFVLPETGAIIEYILEKHARENSKKKSHSLKPNTDTPAHQQYTYWMHAAEGSIMALLVNKLLFTKITEKPVPFLIRPITSAVSKQVCKSYIDPSLAAHLNFMNETLSKQEWFAGDEFTAADVMMSFPAEAAATRADMSQYPHIQRFLNTIHKRPAYTKALEVGGEYDYA